MPCNTCLYLVNTVECRRYPPTVLAAGTSIWPRVEDDDWCGEWKAGPATDTTSPAPPTLTSLTPSSLPAGSTPATVDIVGSGFDPTSVIWIDGESRATFYLDDTHLQYTARPDLQTGPVTVEVTVESQTGTSNALEFSFT
jgi:hypothetical protein